MIFEACKKGNLNPARMLFAGYYNKTALSERVLC
jgi:hypothetical protein